MPHNCLQCQEMFSIRGAKIRLTGVATSGSFLPNTGESRPPSGQSPRQCSHHLPRPDDFPPKVELERAGRKAGPEFCHP
jgi:hypothetical protein